MTGSVLLALLLVLLALADCAFAGFRSHLGRDARLPDRARSLHAARRGVVIGFAGIVVAAAWAVAELTPEATRQDRIDDMTTGGLRALALAGPALTLALLALVVYVLPNPVSTKTLAMTVVLGPFTLLRPLVIVAVVAAGASANLRVNLPVVAIAGFTCLAVEPLLAIRYRASARTVA